MLYLYENYKDRAAVIMSDSTEYTKFLKVGNLKDPVGNLRNLRASAWGLRA